MFVKLVQETDLDTFLQDNHDKLVLVKFSTTWCPPCQVLQKNIQALLIELEKSGKPEKNLVVLEVDAEKFPRLAQRAQFRVSSVPTIFLFHQGRILKKSGGILNVQQLREFIGV